MKVKSSLCVFASLLVTFTVTDAQLAGSWPPLDKPPPATKEFTDLVDLTKVAKAPVVKTVGDCPAKDTFCNWSCTGCTRNASDITKCPTKGDWGITFDDGPTPFTTGLLDFLDKDDNTKVTFFAIGSRVVENPDILKRAVDSGHQIGVHTWSHTALTTQTNEEIIAELEWTKKAIKAAAGVTPKYMRPPFGDYDDRVRDIATQLGYKIVIWDLDTNDWMSADDPTFQLTWIEGNFTQWVKMPSTTGHISLEHDLYNQTAARAQIAIPIVQKAGFLVKPVATCVGDPHPYVEDVPVGGNSTAAPAAAPATSPAASPAAAPAAASSPAAAYPSSAPASSPASGGGYAKYLDGGSSSSTPSSSASPSASASSMPNNASLNNNNLSLLSGLLLIVGTFMFI